MIDTSILQPGFYPQDMIPMHVYLSDPCPIPSLSAGAANTLLTRSPRHVYADHPRFGGRHQTDSAASDMGSLMHDLLLGGEGKICIIEPSDYRSKPTKDNPEGAVPLGWTNAAIRAARDEARENGLLPVLAGEIAGARAAVKVAHEFIADSELSGLLDFGEAETTMIWTERAEKSGVEIWCRARPDWLNHHIQTMVHYKTTKASAAPAAFSRLAVNSGYDVALAFYRRGFERLMAESEYVGWRHVILAQEQQAPYACSLIGLDPAAWAIADEKVARALKRWAYCTELNQWPAYTGCICNISPTSWQLAEAEAQAAVEVV